MIGAFPRGRRVASESLSHSSSKHTNFFEGQPGGYSGAVNSLCRRVGVRGRLYGERRDVDMQKAYTRPIGTHCKCTR